MNLIKNKSCTGYTKVDYTKTSNDDIYVAQHKYDGSNFQIMFTKFDDFIKINFASRNKILTEEQDFNQHRSITTDAVHEEFFENIKKFLKSSKYTTINLYGEIYGHVFKRIKYIEPLERNKIKYFDVVFDGGKYENAKFFMNWANQMKIPTVETFFQGSLEECINFDFNGKKTPFGDDIEGVVIKPYDFDNGIYFKKKRIGFEEIGTCKNKIDPARADDFARIMFDLNEFNNNYLTKNRANCVLSKEPLTYVSKMINQFLNDALEEFKCNYKDTALSFDLLKKIFSKKAYRIIKC